jgi:hypothetical protein
MAATIGEKAIGLATLTNKDLLGDQLWARLVNRIHKDNDTIGLPMAEHILDQAIGFLKLCAAEPAGRYSPSPLIDIGWHTFLLYTREYARFCERVAGRFIHHEPSDIPGIDYGIDNIARTVAALKAHGMNADDELWGQSGGGGGDSRRMTSRRLSSTVKRFFSAAAYLAATASCDDQPQGPGPGPHGPICCGN